MILQDIQDQALQLPIGERWRLVQVLLNSIQKETIIPNASVTSDHSFESLHPWTQSLIGVIQLDSEELTESYVDYLEEKYR